MLFAYFDYDKDKEPNKNEFSEEFLTGFYNDLLYDKDGEAHRKVKEILFNFYYKGNQVEEYINIDNLKDQLLTTFRNSDINN
ncbi:hypothetical protein YDYSG_55100 [Paenibacillus tyrfis]|nr:hypothetical protein YDYSG_55100 [Paenibacillus tyrfis]